MPESSRGSEVWYDHMTLLGSRWADQGSSLAIKEGWDLFNCDGQFQIQAIDVPEDGAPRLPGGDGEAYALCAKRALQGSALHALALYLDGRNIDDDYVPEALLEWINISASAKEKT